jgi:copper(I)-binding protein
MRRSTWLLAAAIAVALRWAVAADTATLAGRDGWIREAPPVAPVRAGYVELVNGGAVEMVVTGADSPAFGAVEIHEMIADEDGAMRMRPVPRLSVPAGASVALKPGGLHLMLFRPQQPLAPGQSVPVRLHTQSGAVVELSLQVR